MKIKISIANIPQAEVIACVKPWMDGGTAFQGIGFSQEWPNEPTTLIEGNIQEENYQKLLDNCRDLLAVYGETAAWLEAGYPASFQGLLYAKPQAA